MSSFKLFIDSFFELLRKQGAAALTILILVCNVVGLSWYVIIQIEKNDRCNQRLVEEVKAANDAYLKSLERLIDNRLIDNIKK